MENKQKILTISILSLAAIFFFMATVTDVFTSKEEIQRKEVVKKEKEEAYLKRKADNDMIYMARQAVMARLKDPNSADFGDVYRGSSGAVCGSVNAKNSFGGFTGLTRFVSGGAATATFLESDRASQANFGDLWEKMCKI